MVLSATTKGGGRMNRLRRIVANLGWRCAIHFAVLRVISVLPLPQHIHKLHPRAAAHPLFLRFKTSDLDVFGQIFSGDEYASVSTLDDVHVIVDGGANVGYSAAYFCRDIHRRPSCRSNRTVRT